MALLFLFLVKLEWEIKVIKDFNDLKDSKEQRCPRGRKKASNPCGLLAVTCPKAIMYYALFHENFRSFVTLNFDEYTIFRVSNFHTLEVVVNSRSVFFSFDTFYT